MSKIFLFLIVIFLFYKAIKAADDCSDFIKTKKEFCEKLYNITHHCYFLDNQCLASFQKCSDYTADGSNFNDSICTSIIPSNQVKKCKVNINNGNKKCVEEDKICEEHNFYDNCKSLKADEGKRCVLINGTCEQHSYLCTDLDDEKICENNIPRESHNKCVWKSSSKCQLEQRKCSDYIIYDDINGGSLSCSALPHAESKICFLNETNCIEIYEKCGDVTNSGDCKNVITFLDDAKKKIDHENKCVWEDDQCKKEERNCEDYKKREDDIEEFCGKFKPKEDPDSKKICYLEGDKCNEVYKKCEYYNDIDINKREETTCNSIIPRKNDGEIDYHKKCVFNSNKECEEETKNCNEITKKDICDSHPMNSNTNSNKYCLFKKGVCYEEYVTCENYNSIITDVSKRKKVDCESIIPKYDTNKCIYTESKECKTKSIICEEYKGEEESYCKKLKPDIPQDKESYYNCAFLDKKCVTQYKNCDAYNQEKTKDDKKKCETIKLYENIVTNSGLILNILDVS